MNKVLFDLRKEIENKLLPLIDNDYILYGLPFYSNIGDVLIWEGTRQLLHNLSYKCLGMYSSSAPVREKLSKDTIILIIGGGFFGDVWRDSFENVLSVIDERIDNKIIFLPNSISYSNNEYLKSDQVFFRRYKNLYMCFRDQYSYDFAHNAFSNITLLVPDMAFYIDPKSLQDYIVESKKGTLFLQRTDHEINRNVSLEGCEVHDWPTMDKLGFTIFLYKSLFRIYRFSTTLECLDLSFIRRFINYIGETYFRKYMLKTGVQFLTQYDIIITARLHPLILAFLLDKKVMYIDNSNHKISHLCKTWLQGINTISNYEHM